MRCSKPTKFGSRGHLIIIFISISIFFKDTSTFFIVLTFVNYERYFFLFLNHTNNLIYKICLRVMIFEQLF